MKKFLWIALIAVLILSACAPGQSGTQPLPTIVLDSGATAVPNVSQPSGANVAASGLVVPARQARLTSAMGGFIKTVHVATGEVVSAGQVLLTFSGQEKLAAAAESANFELLLAEQALQTLNENAGLTRADAQLRLANAVKALDEAVKRRAGKSYQHGSESTIQQAEADLIIANDVLEKAQEAYNAVSGWEDTNVVKAGALSALANARKAHDRAVANLNYLRAMPNEIDVSQADAELAAAQAEVDAAQAAFDKLKDGPDPAAVQLAEARIRNAQAQVAASQAAVEDLEIKAPFDGTVIEIYFYSGEWVLPGQVTLLLVSLDHLQIQTTDLSERDISAIQVGQPVQINVKALQQTTPGHVMEISALAETLGGDVVYKTTIDMEEIPVGMRAGMSVNVFFGGEE